MEIIHHECIKLNQVKICCKFCGYPTEEFAFANATNNTRINDKEVMPVRSIVYSVGNDLDYQGVMLVLCLLWDSGSHQLRAHAAAQQLLY